MASGRSVGQRPDCHTFLCKFDECELVQLCLRVCVSAFCIIYLTLKLYCALKYGCSFCFIFSPLWLYRAASWVLSLFSVIHALWLVNLAVRTLLHDQLNLKLVLLPNCCVTYHQIFLTYIASRSLKLSFTLICVLKRVNDLKRFQIDSFCFWPGSEIWSRSSWTEIVSEPVRHTIEI